MYRIMCDFGSKLCICLSYVPAYASPKIDVRVKNISKKVSRNARTPFLIYVVKKSEVYGQKAYFNVKNDIVNI